MSKVIVVGGGPAGMFAAIAAAERGHEVVLLEKNEKLGKKLYITGKGRCNITNAGDMDTLFANVMTNPKFLYSAFYDYDNQRVIDFFEENGLATKVERGNRVFPVSDHSSDVIATLQRVLKRTGVMVQLHAEVRQILTGEGAVRGVKLADGSVLEAEQGLALKNVQVRIRDGKKLLYDEFGEMLFTHFGVSGPLILSASAAIKPGRVEKELAMEIDLKPALTEEQLDARLLREFEEAKNKQFKNAVVHLFPAKMIPVMLEAGAIDPEKKVNEFTREERMGFVHLIKAFPLTLCGVRDFNEAIITRGGVSVKEVNPSTMESKLVPGLYFCGELLDLDAMTGGFNLQIAWSTGHLAGESIE